MIRNLSPWWALGGFFGMLAVGTLPASAQVGQLPNSKSIINTRHNLSVSGPGKVKATSEQEICIFCHAPHNASPVQPLWNRSTPSSAYTVYTSPSLQKLGVNIGQPSGSSKLCLSCHDGTIALGSVLSRAQPINPSENHRRKGTPKPIFGRASVSAGSQRATRRLNSCLVDVALPCRHDGCCAASSTTR